MACLGGWGTGAWHRRDWEAGVPSQNPVLPPRHLVLLVRLHLRLPRAHCTPQLRPPEVPPGRGLWAEPSLTPSQVSRAWLHHLVTLGWGAGHTSHGGPHRRRCEPDSPQRSLASAAPGPLRSGHPTRLRLGFFREACPWLQVLMPPVSASLWCLAPTSPLSPCASIWTSIYSPHNLKSPGAPCWAPTVPCLPSCPALHLPGPGPGALACRCHPMVLKINCIYLNNCFNSLCIYLGVELLSHMKILFNLLKNHQMIFHSSCTMLNSHQQMQGSDFSTSTPTLVFSIFWLIHPNWCEVLSHYGFALFS